MERFDKFSKIPLLDPISQHGKRRRTKLCIYIYISELLIKEGVSKAYQFRKYCDQSSTLPLQPLWKLKHKLWPKKAPSLPVAKYNHRERLVTTPQQIINVLLKEFKDRLRRRTSKTTYKYHINNVEENTRLKLDLAWKNKSPPFTKDILRTNI